MNAEAVNNPDPNLLKPPEKISPVAPPSPVQPTPSPVNISQTQVTRVPPTEAKAPATPAPSGPEMDRRTFIKWAAIGWTAFAAAVAGYGTIVLRYFFPNVLFEPKQSFLAGFPDEYEVGLVSERWKADHGVWIARDTEKLYALSTVCTHLGCTPNWLPNENKFKCPCHGSGFYKTGINFEGPAPRPLERFKIGLTDSGEILIDKTRRFQQEKGEWNDPDSYIAV